MHDKNYTEKVVKLTQDIFCFSFVGYLSSRFFALYRGLLPKVMRLGPGGAIMLLVYDHVYTWLKEHTWWHLQQDRFLDFFPVL